MYCRITNRLQGVYLTFGLPGEKEFREAVEDLKASIPHTERVFFDRQWVIAWEYEDVVHDWALRHFPSSKIRINGPSAATGGR